MLSPKRLVEKARKGIFHLVKADAHAESSYFCSTMVADKGHFIVYTEDGVRFMIPLAYLGNPIFQELLNASEDEFGSPGDHPITLRCNASFMEYALSLLKRKVAEDAKIRALLFSLGANSCSESILNNAGFSQKQLVVP